MLILNNQKTAYANFNNFIDSVENSKTKNIAILIILSLILVCTFTTLSLHRRRIHKKTSLPTQDQQIKNQAKQVLAGKSSSSFVPAKQEEILPSKGSTIAVLPSLTEIKEEEEKETPAVVVKTNKYFTFDELMTTTALTQDELFAYAKDSCRQSAQEGLSLMQRVAQMGHVEAMFLVGELYRFGSRVGDKHVAKDIPQALIWFEKAANAGSHKACSYLASMYLNGDGVPKNTREGAKWLLLAFQKSTRPISIDRGNHHVIFGNETHARRYLQENFGLSNLS